jgi:hypothetical protein
MIRRPRAAFILTVRIQQEHQQPAINNLRSTPALHQTGPASQDPSPIMLSLSRHIPKRGTTCQRCLIIRYFILVAIGVAMLTVIADGGLHYLGTATPMDAAIAVIAIGMIGFVVKFVIWRLEERAALNSDSAQASPQEASPPETDQTSSH